MSKSLIRETNTMKSKSNELLNKKLDKTVMKILLGILILIILALTVLALIGISSLTGDYNYFVFTIGGIILIVGFLTISYLIILVKKKIYVGRN